MTLTERVEEYLKEADNIYDLIGNCFGILCDNISNQQAFISQYLSKEPNGNCNPNIDKLNEFSEKIMELVQIYEPSKYKDFLEDIFIEIDNLQLVDYLEIQQNELTVIYSILSAINAEAMNWDRKWISNMLGPLDRQHKTSYRVYFNAQNTLHKDYIEGVGRERVHASTFSEQFSCFRFVNVDKWKENIDVPQVKFIPRIRNKTKEKKSFELKIGVVPLFDEMNFEFVSTIGSGVKVDYSNFEQERIIKRVICSLEKAFEVGCKIIVFSEYVVSTDILNVIKEKIKENGLLRGIDRNPYLVFAGTTWTDDNNNVMKILDSWGEEVGEYYKYSPFTKSNRQENGFEIYEDLKSPGKKCDVFSIEGIGTFLPAICRDVIDGEYTEEITKMLLPLLVVISAWSPSVASFEERQKEFANKFFASSVLANACSSIKVETDKIGNSSIVHKVNTIAGAKLEDICRINCKHKCDGETCIFVVDYDFSYSEEKNTKIDIRKI